MLGFARAFVVFTSVRESLPTPQSHSLQSTPLVQCTINGWPVSPKCPRRGSITKYKHPVLALALINRQCASLNWDPNHSRPHPKREYLAYLPSHKQWQFYGASLESTLESVD